MTHYTDAERAEFERTVADGMYGGLIGLISDHWDSVKGEYKLFQHQVAWIAWKAARRASAAPVPQEPTSKQVVLGAGALLGQPENTADNRHPDWHTAVEKARSVYLAMLAAAPQPPEANPVELHQIKNAAPLQFLEPVAKVEDGGLKWHIPDRGYSLPVRYLQGTHKLYTEQQVRELLAQHGIK